MLCIGSISDINIFTVPTNFPHPEVQPKFNPVSNNGFLLGKRLFYDSRLSRDGTISCANCHQQSAAFANLNTQVSRGIEQRKGTRNTPALFNLMWQKEFMWDGRQKILETVPINALTSPSEMDNSMERVLYVLQQDEAYPRIFEQVYGTKKINQKYVLNALAQFTSMLISADSKYDRVKKKELEFSNTERVGYLIFRDKCASCHTEPLFTDKGYHNNGLDIAYSDVGRDSLTHNLADIGKFRTPSLRNIEITAPYMHDGRFRTLQQVITHYSSGIKAHKNLDPLLDSGRNGLKLKTADQEALISFLKTLTDLNFINDRRFNMN
ncbi:cytochrome c peroxidase [Pedobacter duraquae]|uniref:Cytochrome c peroxidase n=2 Tax=Pedobacter duraquae TaxID=425511 RepID=A0A4R6ID43_9SPHI|nr:cytochrome c peroxidase [Pedobacter duraquae]